MTLLPFRDILRIRMGCQRIQYVLIAGMISLLVFLSGAEASEKIPDFGISPPKDPSKILRDIYREVKELGRFPGDDFIKREFFVGKDDDDTYQNIHALILIRNMDNIERITIQVTYFQSSKNDPKVKYAINMRCIWYALLQDEIVILKSDYDEKEQKKFLPQVLHAIRGKKKLLNMKRYPPERTFWGGIPSMPVPVPGFF